MNHAYWVTKKNIFRTLEIVDVNRLKREKEFEIRYSDGKLLKNFNQRLIIQLNTHFKSVASTVNSFFQVWESKIRKCETLKNESSHWLNRTQYLLLRFLFVTNTKYELTQDLTLKSRIILTRLFHFLLPSTFASNFVILKLKKGSYCGQHE